MSRVVTLLTDFGLRDPYVGVMKAAIEARAPGTVQIDSTHEIERQSIARASFWLERTRSSFPEGAIHLVVVDPGVGTERRAVAFQEGGQYFVGPDNGVFSDVLSKLSDGLTKVSAVELHRESINPGARRGTTFDGRDLFAPAAGLLAAGRELSDLGAAIDPSTLITKGRVFDPRIPRIRVDDHYGNLITDAPVPDDPNVLVRIAGETLAWVRTYNEAPPHTAVALAGSWGTIEIAVREGSAKELLGAEVGDCIELVRP